MPRFQDLAALVVSPHGNVDRAHTSPSDINVTVAARWGSRKVARKYPNLMPTYAYIEPDAANPTRGKQRQVAGHGRRHPIEN